MNPKALQTVRVSDPTSGLFTILQIARALGCSRQNVHQRLASIREDGEPLVGGQITRAWRIGSLPLCILRKLTSKAELKRYVSVAALLNEPFQRFEPEIPFPELAPSSREKALKLQRALRPFLARRNSAQAKAADFQTNGANEYRRIFGYPITPRHWRTLFDRTIDRDNGAEEWDRPEIYVEDKPARISSTWPVAVARERGLTILEDALSSVVTFGELDVERKDYLWMKACEELQLHIESGAHEKKTKRAILRALLASGLLSADEETLRRNLNRYWKRFTSNGAGRLRDRRTLRQKQIVPKGDAAVIAGHALARGGDAQAGWTAARESGDLSPETEGRYATNIRRVPNRVRRDVGPLIKSLAPLTQGERAFRQDGPSLIGDYSGLFAGEVFEMDDWTPEHVCYDSHEDGRPGFRFLQGQLIVVIDAASRRVLEASFTEGAYSARMIRVTLNRACQNYCLCDRLNIESGLWKRSRLIVGRRTVGVADWELGLRQFMEVKNNRRPQGKANVENHFHALGKAMRIVPGFCGNDMRHTMPEELKRQIARVRGSEIHPSEFCLSKNEMFEALLNALAEYNAQPQHFGRLKGQSPNEAWNAKQSPNGRPTLGDKAAYLLAFHRERIAIRKSQIVKVEGGVRHVYHSPDVARFDRRDVMLWWNPSDLSQVAFSSLDRKDGPFVVSAQETTPVTAHPNYEAIKSGQDKINETLAVRRAMFRSVEPWLARAKLRPTRVDNSSTAFGEALDQGFAAAQKERDKQLRLVKTAHRRVRQAGIRVLVDAKSAERKAAAAQLVQEALQNE